MKKILSLVLAIALLFSLSSVAFASLYGEIHLNDPDSWLNLRSGASTSTTIIAYMKHGTVVEMLDINALGTAFHRIRGDSYDYHGPWTGLEVRTGYGHEDYVWGYGK